MESDPDERAVDSTTALEKVLRLDRKHTNFDYYDPFRRYTCSHPGSLCGSRTPKLRQRDPLPTYCSSPCGSTSPTTTSNPSKPLKSNALTI